MTTSGDEVPVIEPPEPLDSEDVAEVASRDSEVDFDDEQQEDQLPLDIVEALEADVMLDDPEDVDDDEDEDD